MDRGGRMDRGEGKGIEGEGMRGRDRSIEGGKGGQGRDRGMGIKGGGGIEGGIEGGGAIGGSREGACAMQLLDLYNSTPAMSSNSIADYLQFHFHY